MFALLFVDSLPQDWQAILHGGNKNSVTRKVGSQLLLTNSVTDCFFQTQNVLNVYKVKIFRILSSYTMTMEKEWNPGVQGTEGGRFAPLSFPHHFLDHSETIDWMSIVEANCVIHWIEVFPAVTFWTTGEVKEHVYVKQQTQICNSWPSFPFTCRLLFIISTHKLEVSRNFLSIRIVLSWFHLLIFYFQKLSTWIWHLPFAVYVKR